MVLSSRALDLKNFESADQTTKASLKRALSEPAEGCPPPGRVKLSERRSTLRCEHLRLHTLQLGILTAAGTKEPSHAGRHRKIAQTIAPAAKNLELSGGRLLAWAVLIAVVG